MPVEPPIITKNPSSIETNVRPTQLTILRPAKSDMKKVVFSLLALLVFLAFPNHADGQVLLLGPSEEVTFSKLEIDARQLGSSISRQKIYRDYSVDGKDGVILFIPFGSLEESQYRKAILRTSSFVENGGRAIILVTQLTLKSHRGEPPSEFIADEFGIAISKKDLETKGKIPSDVTKGFSFSGGEIGCSSYNYEGKYDDQITIECELATANLVPIDKSGVTKQKDVHVDDKVLNLFVEKNHGSGKVILMSSFADDDGRPINSFFNDNSYNIFDNSKVSKSMMSWLLDKDR
jgi:hypothetical protein